MLTFTIRGLFALTILFAATSLVGRSWGLEIAFASLLFWVPIAATVFLHQSGRSRFYRNIAMLVPASVVIWLCTTVAYLTCLYLIGSRTKQDSFVDAFDLVPTAGLAGGGYGLVLTIFYCWFLNARYRLSNDIRPLNWNDLTSRQPH